MVAPRDTAGGRPIAQLSPTMTDYEKQFRKCRNACGEPFPEFVRFFEEYSGGPAAVLDLGCGQGRDSLLAAAYGHTVLGVDSSPTGVSQMQEAAAERGLVVEGVVADVVRYRPRRKYNVVILDRILHLLRDDRERVSVLRMASRATRLKGHVLIADTPKHQPLIRKFFRNAGGSMSTPRKGVLFVQRMRREFGR